jgi:xylulokinase
MNHSNQYFLGIDLGSSSIKAAIVDNKGRVLSQVKYPDEEMKISVAYPHWAEQDPELWWRYTLVLIERTLKGASIMASEIKSIGISYQMHGLVCIDKDGKVLRPAIIWCDGRAVEIGQEGANILGEDYTMENLLNKPGNFTASKLAWVKKNEPSIYEKIAVAFLPGDFIAYRMSGLANTTISGLSEGIFWNFKESKIDDKLLSALDIDLEKLAVPLDSFTSKVITNHSFELATGIAAGTFISYRAGDQPNNALSLGVLDPGEAAGTGGTSGVVYAVSDHVKPDKQSRVNNFIHVSHTNNSTRIGTLLCINGTGILYNWVRKNLFDGLQYNEIESIATNIDPSSNGLLVYPFGNGAERILDNIDLGAKFEGLNFNVHSKAHIARAALEGIAFSFVYGLEIMKDMGIEVKVMKVGNDNLFQSRIFAQTLSDIADIEIQIQNTNGAIGAANAGAYGAGYISDLQSVINSDVEIKPIKPNENEKLRKHYQIWKTGLQKYLINSVE